MSGTDPVDALLAIRRVTREASMAASAEDALWEFTRALPSLVGRPHAERQSACTTFMLTPDARHHLIVAPMNFLPEQYHERVDVNLGHPAHVRETCMPLLLRETGNYPTFVKILQTFRAGSAMFAPLMWQGRYLGTLICASSIPATFSENDLAVHETVAAVMSSVWTAHNGADWMAGLDLDSLPERVAGPDGSSLVR
ncbi:GAF domain-containing protein [Acuticoccus kandeliae]|uniref:GAF domain-containing protein n=1 Tax=Acuticoccus kandeliae TaxID=2073160 RepID=UPI000D3E384B|nr:GAF domain-containing protein [Acuticoccus kandeliae]